MSVSFRNDAPALARDWGIHMAGVEYYLAEDALPNFPPVTAANSGIPSLFTTYTDPKIIKAIITPMKAETIYGSAKKGDWVTDTALFNVVELSGYVSSYDDYSQDGAADANANFPQRQSYHFQTWTRWGEREVERMGEAKIDWVNQKNMASISVLSKSANTIALFGISGMENYGALNDPNLPAAITPTPKTLPSGGAAASNTWVSMTDPLQVYSDIVKAFNQLSVQMGGNLTLESPLKLVIPTERQGCLLYANQYMGYTLSDMLKKNMPNLEIETLPEAGASLNGGASGNTLFQLFVKDVEGQESVTTAFTEKMRAHAVERYSSNFRQKKSQGSWGTIWFYPQAVITMVGI